MLPLIANNRIQKDNDNTCSSLETPPSIPCKNVLKTTKSDAFAIVDSERKSDSNPTKPPPILSPIHTSPNQMKFGTKSSKSMIERSSSNGHLPQSTFKNNKIKGKLISSPKRRSASITQLSSPKGNNSISSPVLRKKNRPSPCKC